MKPPEFNTIDFLIMYKAGKWTRLYWKYISKWSRYEFNRANTQFKTITLRCGFDQKHGFINPCNDLITDNLPSYDDMDNTETYKPVPFHPTDPYDNQAHFVI